MPFLQCELPLDRSLLARHNFYELCPPDGGGSFILRGLFGTLDDCRIADAMLRTPIMNEFGGLDSIDFGRFEKWRTIEKSCWINRCYFIVPLAKMAYCKQDKTLAERVLQIMLRFGRNYPAPSDLQAHWRRVTTRMMEDYNRKTPAEIAVDETDVEYIWYDMQVAQRLICFLYAGFFILELTADNQPGQEELLKILKQHARVIADQEAFQQPYCDNHQSLRAIALYMALPLLHNDSDAKLVERRAFSLCSWHILHEFMPESGALFENSPSYHAFVLWHARDFITLASRRGETIPPEVTTRFEEAKTALSAYRRPDGLALTVNDSYQYNASALAESLGGIPARDTPIVLKPGGLAAGRVGNCYTAIDVSNFIGEFSHYHGGKNSPILMWQQEAFLEDCGCPSYDAEEFADCRRPDWHSTLLVDNIGDARAYSMYGFDRWAELEYADSWRKNPDRSYSFDSTLTSNNVKWNDIIWHRKFTLSAHGLQLDDTVRNSSGTKHTYTMLFTLAPGVSVETLSPVEWLLKKHNLSCRMSLQSAASIAEVRFREIKNCQQRTPRMTVQIQIEFAPALELQEVVRFQF